jgi:threonine dehydrogenase-like Zn-dependent dehydrogenase
MKAFVMKAIGKVGFMEKPTPQDPGPNGAIIKTTRALVCTSDIHTVGGAIGDRKTSLLVMKLLELSTN